MYHQCSKHHTKNMQVYNEGTRGDVTMKWLRSRKSWSIPLADNCLHLRVFSGFLSPPLKMAKNYLKTMSLNWCFTRRLSLCVSVYDYLFLSVLLSDREINFSFSEMSSSCLNNKWMNSAVSISSHQDVTIIRLIYYFSPDKNASLPILYVFWFCINA